MNAIEIKGLTKYYKGFALKDINLALPEGCIMGLVGENGAGKSTTIRLLLRMARQDKGSITLLGKDNGENIRLIKEDLGVVPDEIGFPECMTVKKVNAMMKHTYRNWQEDVFHAYAEKFQLPEKKEFKEFSKGMRMKLGIAVALSHRAKLLILDEATSGLDPVVRDEVVELLNEFTREESHAVLISSHIVSDLEKICDYIAFLHKGRLMLCEEKDVLLEQYVILHCTEEELAALPEGAVKGKKRTPYGTEVLIQRAEIPAAVQNGKAMEGAGPGISPVSIEDLFVFMAKEA